MNGNGSTDIVWSTPSAAPEERFVYLDLVGDVRPNLLVAVENGLGKTGELRYGSPGAACQEAREFRGFAQVVRTELGDANEATAVQVHGFDLGQAAECRKGSLLSLEARTETGVLLLRDTY